jgi:hypothetical protein
MWNRIVLVNHVTIWRNGEIAISRRPRNSEGNFLQRQSGTKPGSPWWQASVRQPQPQHERSDSLSCSTNGPTVSAAARTVLQEEPIKRRVTGPQTKKNFESGTSAELPNSQSQENNLNSLAFSVGWTRARWCRLLTQATVYVVSNRG